GFLDSACSPSMGAAVHGKSRAAASTSSSRFLTTCPPILPSKLLANDTYILIKVGTMLWTLFVVLLVLWLLGVVSSYTMGGFIHLLLVLAVIALIFQLITGRRTAV